MERTTLISEYFEVWSLLTHAHVHTFVLTHRTNSRTASCATYVRRQGHAYTHVRTNIYEHPLTPPTPPSSLITHTHNYVHAQQYAAWNKELREPNYYNIVVDWHLYQFQFPHYSTNQHIAAARAWEQVIETYDAIHPVIVGTSHACTYSRISRDVFNCWPTFNLDLPLYATIHTHHLYRTFPAFSTVRIVRVNCRV